MSQVHKHTYIVSNSIASSFYIMNIYWVSSLSRTIIDAGEIEVTEQMGACPQGTYMKVIDSKL